MITNPNPNPIGTTPGIPKENSPEDLIHKNTLLKFKQEALDLAEKELAEASSLLFEVGKIILYKRGQRKGVYRGRIVFVFANPIDVFSKFSTLYIEVREINAKKVEKISVRDVIEFL